MMVLLLLVLSIFSQLSLQKIQDDYYSSIPALEKILNTEWIMFQQFEKFIHKSEMKISNLKRNLLSYKKELSSKNGTIIHSNSITTVVFIKDFLDKLKNVLNLVKELSQEELEMFSQFENKYPYPALSDLEGATMGILRLQTFYDVNATEISEGKFLGEKNKLKFSASDYFQIGFSLHILNEHKFASEWLVEALKSIDEDVAVVDGNSFKFPINKELILDLLSFSKWKEGGINNLKLAIEYASHAININPINEKILKNLRKFQIDYQNSLKSSYNVKDQYERKRPQNSKLYEEFVLSAALDPQYERQQVKIGCAGMFKKHPSEIKALFCKYENNIDLYLKIAPLKIEILNLEPYVGIAYDIIYDNEIIIVKDLVEKNLIPATTWNFATGEGFKSSFRTSKLAWLSNQTDALMHTLNTRLSHLMGLSLEYAEDLQVLSYGIGGHYDIHADALREPDAEGTIKPYGNYYLGNRLATVLFYMSDVEKGGATVFPHIDISVFPKKGSALFWYNLNYNGEEDIRARHAACPVISGSKWVSNKWIRNNEQIFRRLCKLKKDKIKIDYLEKIYAKINLNKN